MVVIVRLPNFRSSGLRSRLSGVPPVLVDAILAVTVSAAVISVIAVATETGARQPDQYAYTLGAIIGCAQLWRRRWPLGVLGVTVAALMVYYIFDYPGIEPAVPLAAALYSAGVAGRLGWATSVAVFFTVLGIVVRRFHLGEALLPLIADTVDQASLLILVVLFAESTFNRRTRAREAAERLAHAELEQVRDAERRIAQERIRIARDIHDVVAHTISAITVQVSFAEEQFDRSTEDTLRSIRAIRIAARQAMVELRSMVGVLRDDNVAAPTGPSPGLRQLGRLLDVARSTGLQVETTLPDECVALPPGVDLGVYRIVQESLTNTIRHANATSVTVTVTLTAPGDALVVRVVDNGIGEPAGDRAGHGLLGMAERVHALNGDFEAGPLPAGGFGVRARIPLDG